jgi:hypothetical protein
MISFLLKCISEGGKTDKFKGAANPLMYSVKYEVLNYVKD